jgi:NAD(P)-dependent dehydrogenase (short-subunit alcohol dehydrogenase family)
MKRTFFIAAGLLLGLGSAVALKTVTSRKRYSFAGRTVIITGGSRGLGLSLARRLAPEGARLALLATHERELRQAEIELRAGGASVLGISCDIRRRDQVEKAIQTIAERFGRIDVLINNAGVIQVGPREHMTVEDFDNALGVHLYGALYTVLAALPHLRRAGESRIVNITSIGGKIAVPHMLPYVTSKFAQAGFSEGLRAELRRQGVLVTTVIPGLMRTGSPHNAQFKGKFQQEYAWFAISDSLPFISMSSDRAAKKIMEACRRGSSRLVIGIPAKAALLFTSLFPGITGRLLEFTDFLLPNPEPGQSNEVHIGYESRSTLTPSWLLRLTDRAALRNNQRPEYGLAQKPGASPPPSPAS